MMRKLLLLASVAAMLIALTLGIANEVQGRFCHVPARMQPCPVRLYLGQSSNASYRFFYSASYSWYSSIGYVRLKGHLPGGKITGEAESWFHMLCMAQMALADRRIPQCVRQDDIFPSHIFQRAIIVPRGTFFAIFAVYPTIAFIRGPLRRWRQKHEGTCHRCGYNLTGNVTGICPECGHPRSATTLRPPTQL